MSMLHAAQLAVREINAQGGVRNRQLELVVRDDSAKASNAVAVASELRDDPGIVAVIGHLTSATTIPAAGVYNAGSSPVVSISPSASTPDLAGIGPFTFRVCASDDLHGPALANWASSRLQARAVAVLYSNDDYGRGVLESFATEFERLGGTITERDPLLASTTDLSPYLERIRQQGRAQAILVATARTSAALILRQARTLGLTLPVLGPDALTGIQGEGAIADGVFVSSNYLPDIESPANSAFVRAYRLAFPGEQPDHRGAGAYDAVHLIADAVREAGTSRRNVRDALARLGHGRDAYVGVTGTITFDENGDVPGKRILIGVVRGGRLTTAEGQ